ncbi:MAG TPA: acetamidase/formamidase family protein [Clostridia bacterium]|nr:acetamidase/formamidase family protein [Clostridia bacterium]
MLRIRKDQVIYSFSPTMKAVAEVDDGAIVLFESNDCFMQQVQSEQDALQSIDREQLNPATGPVHVRGARAGDLLKVDILAIDVSDHGSAAVVPGEGILGDEVEEAIVRIMPIENGEAVFQGIRMPIQPMIGVIGVAPADHDGPCRTDTPWKHGGNMDTRDIRRGATLYFPVHQEGALFALGDCHALMADGEVCFTGLEITAEVTVRLSVVKGKTSTWPLLEVEDSTMVIGSGETLEKAAAAAISPIVACLAKAFNLMWEEAYILASLMVDIRISQVVDPMRTVRAVVPKYLISTENLLEQLSS